MVLTPSRPRAAATRAAATLAAPLLVALLLGSCAGSASKPQPPPPNAAATVTIRDISFHPPTVTVKAGQTVAWGFDDGDIAHNVTADGFHSADRTSGYFTHTFAAPGTYSYICTIHSNMNGKVVVTAS